MMPLDPGWDMFLSFELHNLQVVTQFPSLYNSSRIKANPAKKDVYAASCLPLDSLKHDSSQCETR